MKDKEKYTISDKSGDQLAPEARKEFIRTSKQARIIHKQWEKYRDERSRDISVDEMAKRAGLSAVNDVYNS